MAHGRMGAAMPAKRTAEVDQGLCMRESGISVVCASGSLVEATYPL